jgi:hypothetical protein
VNTKQDAATTRKITSIVLYFAVCIQLDPQLRVNICWNLALLKEHPVLLEEHSVPMGE